MARISEAERLLHGPYRPPRLVKGDHSFCLARDSDVVITAWSDGRIPWPRCRALVARGGSGLLLNAELARAVKNASAAAVKYWWGVGLDVVWRWRKALGVNRINNAATNGLIRRSAKAGARAIQEREFTAAERAARRRTAIRLGLSRYIKPGYHGRWWTKKELRLLGTMADELVARRVRRPVGAVRVKRARLGIAKFEA